MMLERVERCCMRERMRRFVELVGALMLEVTRLSPLADPEPMDSERRTI